MRANKEGSLRLLTLGEIDLAKSVFKNSIQYNKVWIHHDSYLPFGLQNKATAMTPNGELYFRDWYRYDFSIESSGLQHLFIHEMTHVWQHEKGMMVRTRGFFSGMVSYRYKLDNRGLYDYPMEQQAQIIADHFLLDKFGYATWIDERGKRNVSLDGDIKEEIISTKYKSTLKAFP
ncbi:type IV secretion protein Rhs [Rouxiella sp. Mn2063]|uniref:type IV secretion protein Rhs n=1 Tax=Rouxiella sp. Mn2063 TaxID=3395262 RepID=UPI003BE5B6C8